MGRWRRFGYAVSPWHLSRKERSGLSPTAFRARGLIKKAKANGSMVVLLYWHKRTGPGGAVLFAAFWLSEEQRDGDYWRMLFPYYDMVEGDAAAFCQPALGAGTFRDR